MARPGWSLTTFSDDGVEIPAKARKILARCLGCGREFETWAGVRRCKKCHRNERRLSEAAYDD